MCGIAGFYGNLNKKQSVSTLQNMLTRIKHRGPDQSGVYIADKVGLGSVRLCIKPIFKYLIMSFFDMPCFKYKIGVIFKT
ncbi:hypothetical protein [Xanthomarina sp.]|uniref:hypothetical protein n=1 Tax=Xanthomarina sp. TaxID=1931211 RepID=UPI002B72BBD1|nr:hypothetical protein [Xanthomarina sp.]HLV39807.1 hypothetical protein [Xanthomarina sp.]